MQFRQFRMGSAGIGCVLIVVGVLVVVTGVYQWMKRPRRDGYL